MNNIETPRTDAAEKAARDEFEADKRMDYPDPGWDFARELELEIEAKDIHIELLRKEIADSVEACAFMRDDKSLGLTVGDRLTVEGVKALRKQRDRYYDALYQIAAYPSGGFLQTQAEHDRHTMLHTAREALKK